MSKKPPFKLRPSAAARWSTCTRSPWLEKDYPNSESPAAAWGTAAHLFADKWLTSGVEPEIEDEEMQLVVQDYVNYVRSFVEEESEFFSEIEFNLDDLVPGMTGTSDAMSLLGTHLDVFDLKSGSGVFVEVQDNLQLLCYIIGAVRFLEALGFEIRTITGHIVQTRMDNVATWDIERGELDALGAQLTAAAERVFAGGEFLPSAKACRFCRAAGDCRAYAKWGLERAVGAFDSLDDGLNKIEELPKDSDLLSTEEVAAILDRLPGLEAWVSQIRSGAFARAMRGESIPGRKLVLGTKHRKWSDEISVLQAFAETDLEEGQYTKRSPVSPAQAAKLLGKTHPILDMAFTPEGDPVLVHEDDKRAPWLPTRVEFVDLGT